LFPRVPSCTIPHAGSTPAPFHRKEYRSTIFRLGYEDLINEATLKLALRRFVYSLHAVAMNVSDSAIERLVATTLLTIA
jgi:hypothetical protein